MAMAEANWSELPTELLNLISQQIDNDLDLIRFRSVCSTWHSSSIPNHHPYSLHFKLQLFVSKESPPCSLSKHTLLLIKPPPPLQTLQPWLIRISKNSDGQTQLFHPLRPRNSTSPYPFPYILDFKKLSAVHLGNHFVMHNHREDPTILQRPLFHWVPFGHGFGKKVVVICHGQKLVALCTLNLNGDPVLFHCREERWTPIPCMLTNFHDICVFKEQFYAVNEIGQTFAFGLDYSHRLVAKNVYAGDMKFLVESEGELLLVVIYIPQSFGFPIERYSWLNVFRLDEKKKRWIKLTNLRDRVLFLGNGCSFSASIAKGGNCVIFMDDVFNDVFSPFHSMHCGMWVFHLHHQGLSPLSDYPHYLNLFWPPPEWIVKCSTSKLDHEM